MEGATKQAAEEGEEGRGQSQARPGSLGLGKPRCIRIPRISHRHRHLILIDTVPGPGELGTPWSERISLPEHSFYSALRSFIGLCCVPGPVLNSGDSVGWDQVPARGPMREAALYSQGHLASNMCHSIIPSFSKCWLSACHVPGPVLTLGHQHDQSR